ncbi:MAG: hypothetical protein IKH97_06900 [Bacteroidales bacterium]|nr:hypothetical protein [Bacteroidales bacterium]
MKKIIIRSFLTASLITTLLFAGCQKDNTTLRLRIGNFGDNSKVYMGGTNGRTPVWSLNDVIWIDPANNTNNSYTLDNIALTGEAKLTLPVSTVYSAIYPFGIGTVTLSNNGTTATAYINTPHEQRYTTKGGKQVVNAPMAGCTLNDDAGYLTFRNLGALLAINIDCNFPVSTPMSMYVDEVVVRSVSEFPLWGEGSVVLTDPNAVCQYSRPSGSTDDRYSVVLRRYNSSNARIPIDTLNNTTNSTQTVYVYVPAVPVGVDNRFSIEVHGRNTSTNAPINMTHTQSESAPGAGNLRRNMIANVGFSMYNVVAPAGAVPEAVFTIGTNGSTPIKVFFAAGNLQYNCSTHVWRIAPHQWDVIGNGGTFTTGYNNTGDNNLSISNSSYTGWIDLFGWATSGYHNSSDANNTRYLPTEWNNSPVNSTYNYYGYGPSTNMTNNTNLNGPNANYDWGVYHSNPAEGTNSNGGLYYLDESNTLQEAAKGSVWRTLTKEEWEYLLTTREVNGGTGVGHTWSGVKLNNKYGILIYPDGYTGQYTSVITEITSVPSRCVFLPIAGQRSVQSNAPKMNSTTTSTYWSASGNSGSSAKNAYSLKVALNSAGTTITLTQNSGANRHYGCPVRLVTPVP